jgi:AcrR family transcriptional regulator
MIATSTTRSAGAKTARAKATGGRRTRRSDVETFDLDNQVVRGTILAGATRVFARQGIVATRVEDILEEAGVARRTFYRYFASKEDVLAALYDVWTGELLRAIEAARNDAPDDPLAGIRRGIDIFLGFFRASGRAVRELVELAMRSDSLLAERRRWARGEIIKILDDAAHVTLRKRLDSFVYYGLLGALEGIALEVSSDADVERARRVLHGLVDQTLSKGRWGRRA